jgi:hypothetical protein
MGITTKSIGWLRRRALLAAVAGLVVVGTGGVALPSDAATPATQIQACYPTAANPAPLEVLHVAGSHCASGFSALTWNITGPLGIPGPPERQGRREFQDPGARPGRPALAARPPGSPRPAPQVPSSGAARPATPS